MAFEQPPDGFWKESPQIGAGNPVTHSAVPLGATESPPPFKNLIAINIPDDGSNWQNWDVATQQWK